jgi:hypothetical protein
MPDDLAGKQVVACEDVLVRQLEGESVLLNLASESYFGLDEVGTRMWTVLTTAVSVEAAVNILVAEYAIERDQLRADLQRFITKLSDAGLVAIRDVPA